jgi:hypothetical protein
MAVLGVLARIDAVNRSRTRRQLDRLPGVTTFSVEDDQRLGMVIERDTIEQAYEVLTNEIGGVPGVLGTWPVYSHYGSDGWHSSVPSGELREANPDAEHTS